VAVASLRTLRDEAQAIPTAYRVARDAVQAALKDGSYTTATIRHLRAEVQGVMDDIRTLRRQLDLARVEDYQQASRADDTIVLVRWEREVRHQLGRLSYQLRRLWETLEGLELGATKRMLVSRSGDTLQSIAARELGSWQEWPKILEANPDVSPGALPSGTVLVIPERR